MKRLVLILLAGVAYGVMAANKNLSWRGSVSDNWNWAEKNWLNTDTQQAVKFDWTDSFVCNVTFDTSLFTGRTINMATGVGTAAGDVLFKVGSGDVLEFTANAKSTSYLSQVYSYVKDGAGELRFVVGDSDANRWFTKFTAPVDVRQGTVTLSGRNQSIGYFKSAAEPTSWTVRNGATLRVASRHAVGSWDEASGFNLRVMDGGRFQVGPDLNTPENDCVGAYRDLWLDGGDIAFACPGAPNLALVYVQHLLKVTGNRAYTIASPDDANRMFGFGYGATSQDNPRCTVEVADVTGDEAADLDIALPISRSNKDGSRVGFIKTGAGTFRLSGPGGDKSGSVGARGVNGDVDVLEGVVQLANVRSFDQSVSNTVYVSTNAALVIAHGNATHYSQTDDGHARTRFVIDHGAFTFDDRAVSTDHSGYCYLGREIVFDDATFSAPMWGLSDRIGGLGLLFAGECIEVRGTKPFLMESFKPTDYRGSGQRLMLGDPQTEFRVADVTGDAAVDMTLNYRLDDWYWNDGQQVRPSKLVKTGAGTLMLKNPAGRFSGGIDIREGTLRLDGSVAVTGENAESFLGCNTNDNAEVLVRAGATLEFTRRSQMMYYTFGWDGGNKVTRPLHVDGGTVLLTANADNDYNVNQAFGPITVENGAQILYTTNSVNGPFSFHGTFKVRGNQAFTLPAVTGGENIMWLYPDYQCTFDVADVTGDARPDFVTYLTPTQPSNTKYYDEQHGSWTYGFTKTGAGTMALMRADPKWCHTLPVKVNAGILLVQDDFGRSSGFEVAAGASIGGSGRVRSVTLAEGAGFACSPSDETPLRVNSAVAFPPNGKVVLNVTSREELARVRKVLVKSEVGGEGGLPSYSGAENLSSWTVSIPGFESYESRFRLRLTAEGLVVRGGTNSFSVMYR